MQLGYAFSSGSFGNLTLKQGKSHFNGNLGVGENDPLVPLHVAGTTYLNGRTEIDTTTLVVDDTNNKVGIGTSTPTAKAHIEGDFVATGVQSGQPGQPPITGPGTRMMWYPDRAAFRVGVLEAGNHGNWWDRDSIGNYSLAFGKSAIALGTASFAGGFRTEARGSFSAVFGS